MPGYLGGEGFKEVYGIQGQILVYDRTKKKHGLYFTWLSTKTIEACPTDVNIINNSTPTRYGENNQSKSYFKELAYLLINSFRWYT